MSGPARTVKDMNECEICGVNEGVDLVFVPLADDPGLGDAFPRCDRHLPALAER